MVDDPLPEGVIDAVFECQPCKGRGTITHYEGGGGFGGFGCMTRIEKCFKCWGTGIEGAEAPGFEEMLAEVQAAFPADFLAGK